MITTSLLAALGVVFAIWVPQNRDEFVEAVARYNRIVLEFIDQHPLNG